MPKKQSSQPYRPSALKVADRICHLMDRIFGPMMMPDMEKLMEEAREETELDDFSDATFQEPLQILCDALRTQPSRLTAFGRVHWNKYILDRLMNRLRIQKYVTDHPDILRGEIPKPVFILGLPRTGTTLLHRLLAQDPANRSPRLWEMSEPIPPPEQATYHTDPRIRQWEDDYKWSDYITPNLKRVHALDARSPDECTHMMANAFVACGATWRKIRNLSTADITIPWRCSDWTPI